MPSTSKSWYDEYFISGWAEIPKHGKTKGHTYLTEEHKEMITQFFEDGERDKGLKMSAALMVEAMKSNVEMIDDAVHPHRKHYLPSISEVTVIINQLSSKRKKNKQ